MFADRLEFAGWSIDIEIRIQNRNDQTEHRQDGGFLAIVLIDVAEIEQRAPSQHSGNEYITESAVCRPM